MIVVIIAFAVVAMLVGFGLVVLLMRRFGGDSPLATGAALDDDPDLR